MSSTLSQRPAVIFFVSLAIGMAFPFGWWHLLLVIPVALAVGWKEKGWIALAAVALGFLLHPQPPSSTLDRPMKVKLEALVSSVPSQKGGGLAFEAESPFGRIWVDADTPSSLSLGDRVELTGWLRPAKGRLATSGRIGTLRASGARLVRQGFFVWRWALASRDSFRAFLAGGASPRTAGLLQALCFGVTDDIDPQDLEAIRRSGAAHLVAASGLNVVILAAAILGGLSWLPIPRWLQLIGLMIVLVAYAGAAGLGSPIVRAILMAGIHLFAEVARREPDALSSVSAAGSIGLILDPRDVTGAGFWLSYTAVFALILFTRAEVFDLLKGPQGSLRDKAGDLVVSSLVAGLATAPLTALVFGEVPILGVAANLLAAPLCGVLTLASLGLWLLWPLAPAVMEGLLAAIVEPLTGFVLMSLHLVAAPSWAVVSIPSFPPILAVAAGLWLLFSWHQPSRPSSQ